MKLTRDNFQELLTPIHKKIIADEYAMIPEQYPTIFKVGTMDKKDQTYPHMGAFGRWSQNTEGNTINEDEMSEGEVASFEAQRRDKGYTVTWELTKDDLYGVLGGRGVGGSAKQLARGLRNTLERDAANVLNNGFANTGYDGAALFSNSHPLVDSSSVGDNLTTGALTPGNLKLGQTLMRNQVNQAGIKIQARAKRLITGPDLEFTALEITKSTNQAFEMSNTKNVIEGLLPIVMDEIDGDSWFLQDPNIDNLLFLFRERPWYDSQKLQKSVDFFMFGFTRYDVGYCDYLGLVGSQGA
ncbi:Mu-like prophage major head subunit gpT family protein [Paenibacillus contaminans]|uniref:Uncharacterized protein n=1 Tax=Paenibacillus contaminans TaxID=450362 RepID=A0A329MWI7_9BACL|nr:Mu-like prophage major head subunit gpT family protein [Paenibacillus contaminans]RAV22207.1 hypothetical protein DQG23_04445 [Paenibacillus contaminans]